MSRTSTPRANSGLIEVLRLLVVLFCAGLGFEFGRRLPVSDKSLLGPFDALTVSVIVAVAVGYVLGGVVARTTMTSVDRTEAKLREATAESLIASGIGAGVGAMVTSAVTWPLLLLRQPYIAYPVFLFCFVTGAMLGSQLGKSRPDTVLGVLGSRASTRVPSISQLPRLVDSSAAIDGRVLEIVKAGFLHGRFLIPAFMLAELQGLADASDPVRRAKGRRGLDVLEALRSLDKVTVEVIDEDPPGVVDVDAKLVALAQAHAWALLTLDTNLAKVASLAGVAVLNVHSLVLALRPPVASGDDIRVLIQRGGKEDGQGVGYLDDGTMVVAERCKHVIGSEVDLVVTSVLTTGNGRMIFAKPVSEHVE